jgi:hypothetical protein
MVPDLGRERMPELPSHLVLELVTPELVHELHPELLPELADDRGGIDATEGRIHPDGERRLVEPVSVVEIMNGLDGGGPVDRGRRKHGARPLVTDTSDQLAVAWRQVACVGRQCHGFS